MVWSSLPVDDLCGLLTSMPHQGWTVACIWAINRLKLQFHRRYIGIWHHNVVHS